MEGSLCLLSRDFRPWTVMNPSSLVEGAIWGVAVGIVLHGGGGGNSSQGCLWASAPPPPGLAPPRRPVYDSREHLHLPGSWWSPPCHTLPCGPFPTYSVGAPSPPYDVVIFTLQPMDLEVSNRVARALL